MSNRSPDRTALARSDEGRFVLTLWTGDADLARAADRAGVDRVGVDLEVLRKAGREGGLDAHTPHHMDDIPAIAEQLTQARLFARANSLHDGSRDEVERLLDMGVEVLMLPYFTSKREVAEFAGLVRGRARVVPLVETVPAAQEIAEIAALDEIEEVHVGIKDLAFSMGFRNQFVPLTTDIVDRIAASVVEPGKRLGIGSIGRAMDDSLPVASDLVYAQYARLSATAAVISQQFLGRDLGEPMFAAEVKKTRERMGYWFARDAEEIEAAHREFCAVVQRLTGVVCN